MAFEENGIADPADIHGAPGAVTTVAGQPFHVAVPGEETLVAGRLALDACCRRRRIDWIDGMGDDAGRTIRAIHELEGDRFRFAAADPGMPRPEGFAGGPGIAIRAVIRV